MSDLIFCLANITDYNSLFSLKVWRGLINPGFNPEIRLLLSASSIHRQLFVQERNPLCSPFTYSVSLHRIANTRIKRKAFMWFQQWGVKLWEVTDRRPSGEKTSFIKLFQLNWPRTELLKRSSVWWKIHLVIQTFQPAVCQLEPAEIHLCYNAFWVRMDVKAQRYDGEQLCVWVSVCWHAAPLMLHQTICFHTFGLKHFSCEGFNMKLQREKMQKSLYLKSEKET